MILNKNKCFCFSNAPLGSFHRPRKRRMIKKTRKEKEKKKKEWRNRIISTSRDRGPVYALVWLVCFPITIIHKQDGQSGISGTRERKVDRERGPASFCVCPALAIY